MSPPQRCRERISLCKIGCLEIMSTGIVFVLSVTKQLLHRYNPLCTPQGPTGIARDTVTEPERIEEKQEAETGESWMRIRLVSLKGFGHK